MIAQKTLEHTLSIFASATGIASSSSIIHIINNYTNPKSVHRHLTLPLQQMLETQSVQAYDANAGLFGIVAVTGAVFATKSIVYFGKRTCDYFKRYGEIK